MADIESLLKRWQTAGVLDAETAGRIRAHEAQHTAQSSAGSGLKWQGVTALILGAILLAAGVVLFVYAHWDQLGPGERFSLVVAMVAVFHIGGGLARANFHGLSTALHAVGTVATGAGIALVGQIFNIQEHWPAAILLWAIAALLGWLFLQDQAQKTLALLLVPAWIFCELGDRMNGYIGDEIYIGRLCFVWAILYITFFIGSRHKAVQGILFAIGAIGAVTSIVLMLSAWESWGTQTFIPFGTRFWTWIAIAALPLLIAAFHGHQGLVPIAAAIGVCIALPWCYRSWTEYYAFNGVRSAYTRTDSNVLAPALVAAFAVFLCWWGVRLASRAMVNLGIVGFAATVGWFYFSNIMSSLGRSMGLIGLGVLFLAGGWALEKMRRRLLTRMAAEKSPPQAAANVNGGAL